METPGLSANQKLRVESAEFRFARYPGMIAFPGA
jgi:hypothetical protein